MHKRGAGGESDPEGKDLEYTGTYGNIYMNVITETDRRENYRHILNANNKIRAVWQIINKLDNKQ